MSVALKRERQGGGLTAHEMEASNAAFYGGRKLALSFAGQDGGKNACEKKYRGKPEEHSCDLKGGWLTEVCLIEDDERSEIGVEQNYVLIPFCSAEPMTIISASVRSPRVSPLALNPQVSPQSCSDRCGVIDAWTSARLPKTPHVYQRNW